MELNILKIVDPGTEEEFEITPPQEDYLKIIAGDYELANVYLQKAIERKNRLLAMRLVMNKSENTGECSKSVEYSNEPSSLQSQITEDDSGGKRWSDKDIKYLVELYRENEHKFNNPKFKDIWLEISLQIGNFKWEQCENKFKNLKKTYKRIVDSNKSTGRGKIDWPYFQLLDELFKSRPEMEPVSLVFSSDGFTSNSPTECGESSTNKRKRISQEPAWFKKFREDQERRHQEKMQQQREFLDILRESLNK